MANKKFNTFGIVFVLLNIVLAVGVVALIIMSVKSYTRTYTEHGSEVEVPDIKGKTLKEAEATLAEKQLHLVVIDSIFSDDEKDFGRIAEQDPQPHISDSLPSHVKHGRAIYVTIFASSKQQVSMPDLQNMSCRQAESLLRGLGLKVDEEYDYEPSDFRNVVLEVKSNGVRVNPGKKLPVGTTVRLVVGFGRGTEEVEVPSIVGYSLEDVTELLRNKHLTVGAVHYDEPAREGVAQYVYRQKPKAGKTLIEGESVELYMSADKSKANYSYDEDEEDEEDENWF